MVPDIKGFWLLLVDLDGTLWDHVDISTLQPPFRRISEDTLVDARGVEVHLRREAVKLIEWARENGAFVATLSWNMREKAEEALRAFGLEGLFNHHLIEFHPRKDMMLLRFLVELRDQGIEVEPGRIIYIDDSDIHLPGLLERVGPIVFLQAWRDFHTGGEAASKIREALGGTEFI